MDKRSELPFEAGQMAEARSFILGFRGAWFRCKIKEIGWKKGQIGNALEYFDFPDEKINWTKLYQKPPLSKIKGGKKIKKEMMVRPFFPPVYRESQMPDFNNISEVTVIVDDVWKVGDLVDWWTDGCYWSGRLTQILGDDKARIEFPQPPFGEGLSYDVLCKDLRPSLDWSPEHGWTVPIPTEGENCRCCARLVQSVKQEKLLDMGIIIVAGPLLNLAVHDVDDGKKEVQATAGSSFEFNASFCSHISATSSPRLDRLKQSPAKDMQKQPLSIPEFKETRTSTTNMDLDMGDGGIGRTSCSDSVSSSLVRDASDDMAGTIAGKDQCYNSGSSKKMRTGGSISLNSMCSDTLEATILDLEELANKVKWLKGVLEFGIPLSNARQPSWKFLEHRASSTPK